jgi:hypothetical protein
MVLATNERDVKLVQNIDGKSIRIKTNYQAYFNRSIQRLLFSSYITVV